jgi:hypothetical protein
MKSIINNKYLKILKFLTSFIENGQVKGRRPAGLEPNLSFNIVCNNASPPD